MTAPKRVAHAAETIRARWEQQVSTDPQTEAAQALEDTGQLLDPEVAAELLAFRKARELAVEVAKHGAFPVPVGPQSLKPMSELECLRARVAELEAERAKYVGAEPTIAEEMAYLSRCIDSVLELCDKAEQQAERWETPLPVPEWVARVREAADGLVERSSYPPALPWAVLMDDEDRAEFLDELAAAATIHASSDVVLAEVEKACGTWRLIAEAQHGHNTAPGPDAVTPLFPTVAALRELSSREEPHDSPLHHDYRVSHDRPETSFTRLSAEQLDEINRGGAR